MLRCESRVGVRMFNRKDRCAARREGISSSWGHKAPGWQKIASLYLLITFPLLLVRWPAEFGGRSGSRAGIGIPQFFADLFQKKSGPLQAKKPMEKNRSFLGVTPSQL